jgi:hypothetical protein
MTVLDSLGLLPLPRLSNPPLPCVTASMPLGYHSTKGCTKFAQFLSRVRLYQSHRAQGFIDHFNGSEAAVHLSYTAFHMTLLLLVRHV